jgi:hypothetical protein
MTRQASELLPLPNSRSHTLGICVENADFEEVDFPRRRPLIGMGSGRDKARAIRAVMVRMNSGNVGEPPGVSGTDLACGEETKDWLR